MTKQQAIARVFGEPAKTDPDGWRYLWVNFMTGEVSNAEIVHVGLVEEVEADEPVIVEKIDSPT